MMQLSIGILVLVVAAGVASPISRQKRFAPWDPWTSTGAMAGGFAGGGGAFAGAGAGFMPFPFMPMTPDYVPRVPYYYPMNFPFNFNFPQPWYKGANVCVERRVVDEPDEFKELMDDPSLDPGRYEHESQSCRGSDTAYVCTGRVMTNNGSKMYVTKYQCCHGFIRPYNGQPGCVESPNSNGGTPSTTQSSVRLDDSTKYSYIPKNPEPAQPLTNVQRT